MCAECVLADVAEQIAELDDPSRRLCRRCEERRPVEDFYAGRRVCKGCIRLKKYGLTQRGYDILMEEQGGQCPICETSIVDQVPAVDHDHETGQVRGLLCTHCNWVIGLFGDDPERLRRAADFLTVPPATQSYEFNLGPCGCGPSDGPLDTVGQRASE
jgi:hypothetical protein